MRSFCQIVHYLRSLKTVLGIILSLHVHYGTCVFKGERISVNENIYFQFLYKEYSALYEKVENHIRRSLEDFKLLGVAGGVLA